MGAPLPPNAIMPPAWAAKAELRTLPGDPEMEPEVAYWIEELSAWIAEDEEDETIIRDAVGDAATILQARDLK